VLSRPSSSLLARPLLSSKCIKILIGKQKALGRTNYLLSFDTTMNGIENDASNNKYIVKCVFLVMVKFLSCCCLATIGDTHSNTQTDGRDL
jgi:hypothetical protein